MARKLPAPPQDDLADAIVKYRANLGVIAKIYDVPRHVVDRWVKSDPQLLQLAADMREIMLDDAEQMLHAMVLRGEPWAIKFVLNKLGAERGYRDQRHQSHDGTVEVVVRWQQVENPHVDDSRILDAAAIYVDDDEDENED